MLENNVQMAIQQQIIELADAIDIREIKNIKLANQLLKIRRQKKLDRDQAVQQQNMQQQAQLNQQSAQAAAQAEMQKNQALNDSKVQLEQLKAQLESQKMAQEVQHKKELMQMEFEMNMQLKNIEVGGVKEREKEKEDRKDERTRIQATQQSELIEQRKGEKAPKNFESSGNDILGGGFGLDEFGPR